MKSETELCAVSTVANLESKKLTVLIKLLTQQKTNVSRQGQGYPQGFVSLAWNEEPISVVVHHATSGKCMDCW